MSPLDTVLAIAEKMEALKSENELLSQQVEIERDRADRAENQKVKLIEHNIKQGKILNWSFIALIVTTGALAAKFFGLF